MRENRTSGSEGGGAHKLSLPLSSAAPFRADHETPAPLLRSPTGTSVLYNAVLCRVAGSEPSGRLLKQHHGVVPAKGDEHQVPSLILVLSQACQELARVRRPRLGV